MIDKVIADLLAEVPAALVHELEALLHMVLGAPSPADAISRAQQALLADAADAGTDAALREILKRAKT